jgi:hypothetical protein
LFVEGATWVAQESCHEPQTVFVVVQVKNGGVGTHLFYVLQVQRPKEVQNNLMFVTDRQGRLQHVTQVGSGCMMSRRQVQPKHGFAGTQFMQ